MNCSNWSFILDLFLDQLCHKERKLHSCLLARAKVPFWGMDSGFLNGLHQHNPILTCSYSAYARASQRGRPTIQLGMEQVRPGNNLIKWKPWTIVTSYSLHSQCVPPCLQLGLGDSADRNVPSQVSVDRCLPKNIACGWWHTLLVAERTIQLQNCEAGWVGDSYVRVTLNWLCTGLDSFMYNVHEGLVRIHGSVRVFILLGA